MAKKKKNKKIKVKFAFKPYPKQQEVIDHVYGKELNHKGKPYRFFIAAWGRQAGKSWMARYMLIDRAANYDENCMWVAPSYKNARDHWNDLTTLIEKSGMIEAGVITKITHADYEIHFVDGGKIQVRSALEKDNLRGAGLDFLVLDEAAFFLDGQYIWYDVLLATITASGGKVLFTTTPNGRNWVYDLFSKGQKSNNSFYKSWHITSYDSPYQDKELLDELRKTMPSYKWRKEYMAEFLASGGGVFARLEEAAIVPYKTLPEVGWAANRLVAGVDIGFNNDYTCFTVIDTVTRQQIYGERFTNVGTIATVRRLLALLNLWRPKVTYIEKNGVGEFLLNLMSHIVQGKDVSDILKLMKDVVETEKLPKDLEADSSFFDQVQEEPEFVLQHKLVGVHVNNEVKRYMVERTVADVEYGRLFLLSEKSEYGAVQLSEMSTYERKKTASGLHVTYAGAEGTHDDTVTALYLAYQGVKRYKPPRKTVSKPEKTQKGSPFRGGSKNFSRRKFKKRK